MEEERIGDRLKRLRIEAGLSQRELAKRSGVDREHINQIEHNRTKSMTLRTAEKLAHGMGITPCRFFDEDHEEVTEGIKQRIIEHIRGFK